MFAFKTLYLYAHKNSCSVIFSSMLSLGILHEPCTLWFIASWYYQRHITTGHTIKQTEINCLLGCYRKIKTLHEIMRTMFPSIWILPYNQVSSTTPPDNKERAQEIQDIEYSEKYSPGWHVKKLLISCVLEHRLHGSREHVEPLEIILSRSPAQAGRQTEFSYILENSGSWWSMCKLSNP